MVGGGFHSFLAAGSACGACLGPSATFRWDSLCGMGRGIGGCEVLVVVVVVIVVVGRQSMSDPTKNRSRQGLMFPCVPHSTVDRSRLRSPAGEIKRDGAGILRDFSGHSLLVCVAHGRGGGGRLPYFSSMHVQRANTGTVTCELNPTKGKYRYHTNTSSGQP